METLTCWWHLKEVQGINKIGRIHPFGIMICLPHFTAIYATVVEIFQSEPKLASLKTRHHAFELTDINVVLAQSHQSEEQ